MKNTIRFFGVIALAAAIGFSFAACSSGSDDSAGRETYTVDYYLISQANWNSLFGGIDFSETYDDGYFALFPESIKENDLIALRDAGKALAIKVDFSKTNATFSELQQWATYIPEGVGAAGPGEPFFSTNRRGEAFNALENRGYVGATWGDHGVDYYLLFVFDNTAE